MPDNFLYSSLTEEGYTNMVTAEDLNNIAIDLGYAEYSHFPEEPPQSAVSALNQITQDLTSKGILQIGNCCKVSMSDGVITVADGVCVFENGAKKRLTEAVSFPYIEGGTNYVYLFNNVSGNQIQLICSLEAPTDGNDYVMLAEVKSSTVTDKRYWSISKVGNGVNIMQEHTETFIFKAGYYNSNTNTYTIRYTEKIIDIPYGANFIIFEDRYISTSKPIAIALFEGEEVDLLFDPGYVRYSFLFKKEGSKLHILTHQPGGNKSNSIPDESKTLTFWLA
jgi:hypothetical protein